MSPSQTHQLEMLHLCAEIYGGESASVKSENNLDEIVKWSEKRAKEIIDNTKAIRDEIRK